MHKLFHKKDTSNIVENENINVDNFAYTGPLRRWNVTPLLDIPEHIKRPDYAESSVPQSELLHYRKNFTPVYSEEEIEGIRLACKIGRGALDAGHKAVAVGVTTDEIDRVVHEYIISQDAYPSTRNYYKFPKSCCTSVNEIICHGIPDMRPLEDGDIVNIDVSVYKNGYHGDLNETFCVGKVAESSKSLIAASHDSLMKAIATCKPGTMYRDLGGIISEHVENLGFSVVKTYCGHGIGSLFHCSPSVPHYAKNKAVGFMKVGHIFTIEPMINAGVWKDVTWKDKWTAATTDGQRSAQFEHQLLITEDGCESLTARTKDSPALEFREEI